MGIGIVVVVAIVALFAVLAVYGGLDALEQLTGEPLFGLRHCVVICVLVALVVLAQRRLERSIGAAPRSPSAQQLEQLVRR
jgi:protein-S-isoprenylcysteine O-methyltransferase Ste14